MLALVCIEMELLLRVSIAYARRQVPPFILLLFSNIWPLKFLSLLATQLVTIRKPALSLAIFSSLSEMTRN